MYDPVGYAWMFKGLRGKYREPEGAPIVRIAKQLIETKRVIQRELELWVRNPEGVCDWLGRERGDIKSTVRLLTNREMYIYFKDCSLVKSRKLIGGMETFPILRFFGVWKSPMVGFSGKFAKCVMTIGEHLNSKSTKKKFGRSDVYDITHAILHRNRIPDSRGKGKDNDREG